MTPGREVCPLCSIFFVELFRHLPPLCFDFALAKRPKVVVYTDASFSASRNGLGVVLIDDACQRRFYASGTCPPWLIQSWGERRVANPRPCPADKARRVSHIAALELLALLSAVLTFGAQFLRGREIVFFLDNTSAMSAAVHGYARSPDLADISNALHLALAGLTCSAWFEWVPSAANCADVPSRPEDADALAFYLAARLAPWPAGLRLPSLHELRHPSMFMACE